MRERAIQWKNTKTIIVDYSLFKDLVESHEVVVYSRAMLLSTHGLQRNNVQRYTVS